MIAKSPDLPVKSQTMRHVDDYLEVGQKAGASDVHLAVNAQPRWRLHGRLEPIWPDAPLLTAEQTALWLRHLFPTSIKTNSIRAATRILRMKTSSPAIAPAWFVSGLESRLSSA